MANPETMPSPQQGEAEWNEELTGERRELKNERAAWDKIQELAENSDYVANMFDIPAEELRGYKEAAEILLQRDKEDNNFNPPTELKRIATEVQKIPE